MRLAQELGDGGDAVVQTHCILGQLCVGVAAREVTQGTDGRLGHVLLFSGPQHGVNERLHPAALGDQGFVARVVAGEV